MDSLEAAMPTQRPGANSISGKMIGMCLGLIALVVIAVAVFKVPAGILLFAGALLLCPLLHVWMAKGGEHKH